MSNLLISVVRTVMAVVIGSAVSWAARRGIDVDEAEVTAWATPVAIATVYAVLRWLEERVPNVGWLLGVPKAPGYSPAPVPPAQPAPIEADEPAPEHMADDHDDRTAPPGTPITIINPEEN